MLFSGFSSPLSYEWRVEMWCEFHNKSK